MLVTFDVDERLEHIVTLISEIEEINILKVCRKYFERGLKTFHPFVETSLNNNIDLKYNPKSNTFSFPKRKPQTNQSL